MIFISLLSVHHANSATFLQSLSPLLLTVILSRISFIFVHSCSYLQITHWWIVNVESSYTTTCSLRANILRMPSFVVTILDDVAPQILLNSWGVTTITVATTWLKQTQIVWEQWEIECFEKHKWGYEHFIIFLLFHIFFIISYFFLSFLLSLCLRWNKDIKTV